MKRTQLIKLTIVTAIICLASATSRATTITIDVDDLVVTGTFLSGGNTITYGTSPLNWWSGLKVAPYGNPDADDIETITSFAGQLTEVYKQDVDAVPVDVGSFASSYTTTYSNSASDPEDADIRYDGNPDPVIKNAKYLLAKDGNAAPGWYIFDISNWDGKMNIDLRDFWIGSGAISHVSILAGGDDNSVPDSGATLILLGVALAGLGFLTRRK